MNELRNELEALLRKEEEKIKAHAQIGYLATENPYREGYMNGYADALRYAIDGIDEVLD